jgi:hypothetical protein
MINTAKLPNESTIMMRCRLIAGRRTLRWQTASHAVSSSLDEAILASILNGWQKEFCIIRGLLRYCGKVNCNLSCPSGVLVWPLVCPISSCDCQSSCSQFGNPIISSPAPHLSINPPSRTRSTLAPNCAQTLSQETRSCCFASEF